VLTTAIRDQGNSLIGFSNVIRDLTEPKRAEETLLAQAAELQKKNESLMLERAERKWAEAELHESETRIQAFSDHSPNLIFLKDLDGRYLYANKEFKRVMLSPQCQIIGKKFRLCAATCRPLPPRRQDTEDSSDRHCGEAVPRGTRLNS
jgi:PAS domain-containing protein